MMVVASGAVTARTDDGNVVATFQSGRDTIEIVMSFHQAVKLINEVGTQAVETLGYRPHSANVATFPAPKRRKR